MRRQVEAALASLSKRRDATIGVVTCRESLECVGVTPAYLRGLILRSRIHNDDLIDERTDRFETILDLIFFVLDDHTQRDGSPAGHEGRYRTPAELKEFIRFVALSYKYRSD